MAKKVKQLSFVCTQHSKAGQNTQQTRESKDKMRTLACFYVFVTNSIMLDANAQLTICHLMN